MRSTKFPSSCKAGMKKFDQCPFRLSLPSSAWRWLLFVGLDTGYGTENRDSKSTSISTSNACVKKYSVIRNAIVQFGLKS